MVFATRFQANRYQALHIARAAKLFRFPHAC